MPRPRSPNPPDATIRATVAALSASDAEGKLHSWLRHPDEAERERVLLALRDEGSLKVARFAGKRTNKSGATVERACVGLLAWLLEHGTAAARGEALSSLGLLATSDKGSELAAIARHAVDAEVARDPRGLVALARRHEVGARLYASRELDPLRSEAEFDALMTLVGDPNSAVRVQAQDRMGAVPHARLAAAAHGLTDRDPGPVSRRAEIWALVRAWDRSHVPRLLSLADADAESRLAVLNGIGGNHPPSTLPLARRMVDSTDNVSRRAAIRWVAQYGEAEDRGRLRRLLTDGDDGVRLPAVRAAAQWADSEGAAVTLVAAYAAAEAEAKAAQACLDDPRTSEAIRWIGAHHVALPLGETPGVRRRRLLNVAPVRAAVLTHIDRLLGSTAGNHQVQGFDALVALDGEDADARVALVLARGPEAQRPRALQELVRRHGAAALAEVVSSLADKTDSVADAARALLTAEDSALANVRLPNGYPPAWVEATVQRLIRWGEFAGLSFLRTPTRVQGWLGGAGRTRRQGKGEQGITIDINFDPLIRAAEHGADVVRGVIVHELGHHKYDFRVPGFRAAAGVVKANRAFRVFNVLLDERLERQLRRDRPEWAIHVDRMNAWLMQGQPIELPLAVYSQAVGEPPARIAERVDAGELPGRRQGDVVRMGPWDALGVPGLVPPLHAFLLGVFVVRDPEQVADPAARQALQMLPKDLAATRHGPLAALAVQITNLLGCHDGGEAQDRRWRELVGAHGGLLGELAGALDRNADVHTLANWASGDRTGADGGWEPGPPIAEADVTIQRHRGRPKSRGSGRMGSTLNINVGQELGFYALDEREHEPASIAATQRLRREVRPHVRRLRGHFERLGTALVETPASRRGRRLDLAQIRDFAATRRPNVLIHAEERVQPDAYVGLIIDRSGSMSVGDRMPLARRFGMLLAESAAGLRGIEGHVSAFDHTHFIRLGDFRRHSIAGLQPGGGNNDAGGLQAAANLALASRKSNRLLIMISDGLPTECSVDALRTLVRKLRRDHDVRCAQVAVAPITEVCFPEFLDVSNVGSAEAIRRFGRLLTRLTRGWS